MRSQKRRKIKSGDLLEVYQAMRQHFGFQHWWPGETPLEIMVGAILTQNTAWSNVEKAINNLKRTRMLTFSKLQKVTLRRLAHLIQPAGYFNVKAKRLKNFIRFIHVKYEGNLALMFRESSVDLREKLLAVNGIGEETADSIILYAANKPIFVIDAYTKRIFSRHGFEPKQDNYAAWQSLFMKTLPQKRGLFNDYHAQIVAVGKSYCKPKERCDQCPLKDFF